MGCGDRLPLLDFVEAGEERDGDEDDDCFFAVANFELLDLERDDLVSWSCHVATIRSVETLVDVDTKRWAMSCRFVSDRRVYPIKIKLA